MRTEAELRVAGTQALLQALGEYDAERYIALVSREGFDYTVWQRELWPDAGVEELSARAMDAQRRGQR